MDANQIQQMQQMQMQQLQQIKQNQIKTTASDIVEFVITAYEMLASLGMFFICVGYGFYAISDYEELMGILALTFSLLLIAFNVLYIVCFVKISSIKVNILIKYEWRTIHSMGLVIESVLAILGFIIIGVDSIGIYIAVIPVLIYEIWKYHKNLERTTIELYNRLNKK